MLKAFVFLFLMGLAFAVPACPSYPYHDYTVATAYSAPTTPPDSLLQYCNWNLGYICVLSNAFNTSDDKKLFIAESIANDSFDQIEQWNQNIQFDKYPPNISKSSTNIKDAWINVAYLNPSVYDNGTYLVNSTFQPLIRYNFTFVVDTRRLPGDCNDNFRICGYSYSISNQSTNSTFTANLNVKSEYLVDRSHWVVHCDKSGCWVTCDYYRTDSFEDSLDISDSKKIRYDLFSPSSNYSVLASYNGLAEIGINANDSEVLFQMGNSSFYKTDYLYGIDDEAGPYNILVKEIIPTNKTSVYGLTILEQNRSYYRLLAPYSGNCSLKESDPFSSKTTTGCDLTPLINSTIAKIPSVRPAYFDFVFDAALLGIVAYILYLVIKRVMPVA